MNERIKNYEVIGDSGLLVTVGHQCSEDKPERDLTTVLSSYRRTSSNASCPECHETVQVVKDLSQPTIVYLAPPSSEPTSVAV